MENKKNTNLLIGLGIVLVVVAAVWYMKANPMNESENVGNGSETVEPTEDTTAGSVSAGVGAGAVSISYKDALIKYKDKRLQLETTCQASPDKATFKNGTDIMIDNRAPVARTVKVGSTFSIKAYGFKIVRLSSATLPATWYVDCDKSQNVATILIQK